MITSLDHDRVKRVRALQSRSRSRRKHNTFVIEGPTLIHDAVAADVPMEEVFYTEAFAENEAGRALIASVSEGQARWQTPVSDEVMLSMSDTPSPQGVLAVLPTLNLAAPDEPDFALIIDGVNDPGNMGALMRTASASGVPVMVITAGTVDLTNPKVVRAAMGAHFRLPVRQYSWEGIANRFANYAVFMAESGGGALYYDVDWTQPAALIVSDEAHGASEEAVRLAHARVTIPMPGGVESLNVAIAAAVMLYERVRQQAQA